MAWDARWAGNCFAREPQIVREKDAQEGLVDQTALCEASVQGKKVTIDLAPSMDDGGLLFEGEFDGAQITGVWLFDSYAGSQPQGNSRQ